MINNPRREFEERQYIEAAFFLQVPAKKLRTLHIVPTSYIEFSGIDTEKISLYDDRNYIKEENGKYYYYGNPSPMKLLCSVYLISLKQTFQLRAMINKINAWENRNANIRSAFQIYHRRLRETLESFGDDVATFQLQTFNIKNINKIMAKHKGHAEITGEHLILTFNKIKCGNETEGYINYKSITVFLPLSKFGTRDLNSERIIYAFQKFSIDTNDKIDGIPTLHPHIDGTYSQFCFGNRDDDWDLYAKTINIPFIIDLIYESLHTFNPGSPYIHVSTLINVVKTLNIVYKDYKKMNPASTPNELASHIFKGVNSCRKCHVILGVDGHCFTSGCRANPNALIPCIKCGVHLERGEWDASGHVYNWICRNTSCVQSPNFIKPPIPEGTLVCRICGEPLIVGEENTSLRRHAFDINSISEGNYTTYLCRNERHGLHGIWQFVRNNASNEVIDLYEHHYTDSFNQEISDWEQNNN